jgi:hypothetical protein
MKRTFQSTPLSNHAKTDFSDHNIIEPRLNILFRPRHFPGMFSQTFQTTTLSRHAETDFSEHDPFKPCVIKHFFVRDPFKIYINILFWPQRTELHGFKKLTFLSFFFKNYIKVRMQKTKSKSRSTPKCSSSVRKTRTAWNSVTPHMIKDVIWVAGKRINDRTCHILQFFGKHQRNLCRTAVNRMIHWLRRKSYQEQVVHEIVRMYRQPSP